MASMACVCIRYLEIWPRVLGNFEKLVTELGLGGEWSRWPSLAGLTNGMITVVAFRIVVMG